MELARLTGSAVPTVHHEVERLERAGVVVSERVGNVRRVRPNRNLPYFPELRALLLKTYGPVALLKELLKDVSGVKEALIFGSWARRYMGEQGRTPGDVDLLIVGDPDLDGIYEVCRRAEEQLGNAVNPSILSPSEWNRPLNGFMKAVKEGPRVAVIGRNS